MRAGLPGISPNVLTQRLGELEAAQVLGRRQLPMPASAWVYEITHWGWQLEPVLLQLAHWGVQSPTFIRPTGLGIDAVMLSLRTMFNPAAANGYTAILEISLGTEAFTVRVVHNTIELARERAPEAATKLYTDPDTLVMLAYGKADLDQAMQAGVLTLLGNKTVLQGFLRLFSLPERIPKEA
ncbi:transcriptional regulator [Alcaligenaceae bacterium]|nr:transcriptional regulator [Alcaligenaceae bacterium]